MDKVAIALSTPAGQALAGSTISLLIGLLNGEKSAAEVANEFSIAAAEYNASVAAWEQAKAQHPAQS
jgi:hypothetical protein